mgnify:FL=1
MASTVTGKAFDFPILKRIYAFTSPYKKAFYTSIFLTLLLTFLSPLRPILVQYTIDNFVAEGGGKWNDRIGSMVVERVQ